MSRVRLLPAACLSWSLAVAACGAEPSAISPCDIRSPACQRSVFLAVQELRNVVRDPWTEPPRVRVISEQDLRDEVDAENARYGLDPWSPTLQDLGLLERGVDSFLATQSWRREFTLAYYYKWIVTVIDRGASLDTASATSLLAHEYVHALQDRETGVFLYGRPARLTENEWIERAIVEGEADLFEALIERRMAGAPLFSPEIEARFEERLLSVRRGLVWERNRDTTVRNWFPYLLGGLAFAKAWNQRGAHGPARLWRTHPARSLAFMSADDAAGARSIAAPSCVPSTPEGFRLRDHDSLGALYFYAFLVDSFAAEPEAWRAALSWRGDWVWLFEKSTARETATLWRVRAPGFDPAPLARAGSATRAWDFMTDGDDLIIAAATDRVVRSRLLGGAACRAP